MIFASLAPSNECVYRHNVRDFPHSRPDSEIKSRFLLNEHGDLYFYCLIIVPMLSSLILRIFKKIIGRKKDIAESVHKIVNYDHENNDSTNALRPLRFKWCGFFHKFHDIVPYAPNFQPVKFSPKYYFDKRCI